MTLLLQVANWDWMDAVSPPIIFASVNALNANISHIKEELSLHRRRRTSVHQIDRFAEAMDEFLIEAEPIVDNLKQMTRDIDDKLKDLITYYGEDPATIKSEEFFDIIQTFSASFAVCVIIIVMGLEKQAGTDGK